MIDNSMIQDFQQKKRDHNLENNRCMTIENELNSSNFIFKAIGAN